MKTTRRLDGWTARRATLLAVLLAVYPSSRLVAQDTSAVDRGVRIGLTYRPGVRPGMVVLPGRGPVLDSVRAIVARDLDYSDRFELITLPGGDPLRASVVAPPSTPTTNSLSYACTSLVRFDRNTMRPSGVHPATRSARG